MSKNVLIIGGGGREHALAWKISQSPEIKQLYIAPGNAGTAQLGENVDIKATDIEGLVSFVIDNDIDFTVVGQDDPLALGIVDRLQEKGKRVFGPIQAAAQIESSKAFSKELMAKNNVPTALFKVFTDYDSAVSYVENQSLPIVVKVSGLALGKGVFICETKDKVKNALQEILVDKKFGAAGGDEVVVEEFMTGPEVSMHVFTDGETSKLFPTSQDHKAIYEGNKGPNTGGMGTIAPLPWVTDSDVERIKREVVDQAVQGLTDADAAFSGLLYPGIMMTKDGPKALEFNARFGDPETQSYMRLLDSDLLTILEACADGKLADVEVSWKDSYAATIILASGGYPESYEKGFEITGINDAEQDERVVVFHAGTTMDGDKLVTNGGRVLGVSATGNTLQDALDTAYAAVEKINFEGKYYRKDIGQDSLNR
jgi:phosphoribosylamine--glycine ligase